MQHWYGLQIYYDSKNCFGEYYGTKCCAMLYWMWIVCTRVWFNSSNIFSKQEEMSGRNIQLSAVIMGSNIVRCYIDNSLNWGRILISCCIHKRHPIPRPGKLWVSFVNNVEKIYHVIMAPHCILTFSCRASIDKLWCISWTCSWQAMLVVLSWYIVRQ